MRSAASLSAATDVARITVVAQFFPYDFDERFVLGYLPFGVRPSRDGVTLTDDNRFVATFGFFRVDTPISNVAGAHVTGPYRWWTAVGARISFVDDGLTFGTTSRRGTCVHFRQKLPSRLGFRPHSALTVTVADPDGLVGALTQA
jgi:hypothetical protein